jgi:hypothetical protein
MSDESQELSVLRQLLGEDHEDPTRTANVCELVDVLIDGDAPKRVVAVPRAISRDWSMPSTENATRRKEHRV